MVFSLALMVADHRQQHLETVRSIISVVVSPLHYVADLPQSFAGWISDTLVSRSSLQEDNARLRKENLTLQAKQQKLATLETENMRLRDLLDSSFKIGDRVLIAELIGVDLDPYRQQVLVNKGSSSGIFLGQPVLDANAVMGQVIHVNRGNATVLLITDARHALPVRVNRNGLRTMALGTGRISELELPNLPNNADIKQGDLLVTSGLGGRFPPGYPVAEVTSVTREPGQPFATILARTKAHLGRAREALLVWRLSPFKDLENSENSEPAATADEPAEAPSQETRP